MPFSRLLFWEHTTRNPPSLTKLPFPPFLLIFRSAVETGESRCRHRGLPTQGKEERRSDDRGRQSESSRQGDPPKPRSQLVQKVWRKG